MELEKINTGEFDADVRIDPTMAGGCTVDLSDIPTNKELVIRIGKDP
jgi:hypothetical protein